MHATLSQKLAQKLFFYTNFFLLQILIREFKAYIRVSILKKCA
jgi:hypothetical protein